MDLYKITGRISYINIVKVDHESCYIIAKNYGKAEKKYIKKMSLKYIDYDNLEAIRVDYIELVEQNLN